MNNVDGSNVDMYMMTKSLLGVQRFSVRFEFGIAHVTRNSIHIPYEYRRWCDTALGIVFRSFRRKHRRATCSACHVCLWQLVLAQNLEERRHSLVTSGGELFGCILARTLPSGKLDSLCIAPSTAHAVFTRFEETGEVEPLKGGSAVLETPTA